MIDFKLKDLRPKILEEGIQAIHNGDPSRVDTALRNAREHYCLEIAQYLLAYKQFTDKDFPGTLLHLEQTLRLDPTYVPAHLLKQATLIEAGQFDEAIRSVDYSFQNLFLTSYAPFYTNKGIALDHLGLPDEAIFCYLRAIEDNHTYERAYQNLIVVIAKKKAWPDLIAISEKITENFSENARLLDWTAGNLLYQAEQSLQDNNLDISQKLLDLAGKQLQLGITRDPDNNSILYNLACFYSRSGERSQAVETFRKALEKTPSPTSKMELLQLARDDVDFTNIREEPLFTELFTQNHLPAG